MIRLMSPTTDPASATAGTRERLVDAAGEVFGEHGFRGATVREITKRAGVNLAAINYYFRDKEELYAEVLRHVVRCVWQTSPDISQGATPAERLESFVLNYLQHILDPSRPDWHGKLIAREMSEPTKYFDALVESAIRPKRNAIVQAIRDIAGEEIDPELEPLICASVIGQCVYYRQNRAVIERLYPDFFKGPSVNEKLARHIAAFSLAGIRALTASNTKH
jgi:TetR/AcrR family transcriptional regulator, regulator of cefoperazone and chloramphenicol sensitivity